MKDFEETLRQDKETAQFAQQKADKLLKTIADRRGLTLYECNLSTRVVQPAEYEEIYDMQNKCYRKKVIVRPGCLYLQSLNFKNAIRRFDKIIKTGKG